MTDDDPAMDKPEGTSRPDAAKPVLLAGGNPQIAKADGDAPVQAYIAAMPGWKRDVGRSLDALIVRTVPGVQQGREVELALLRHRGPGLVPQLPLLHEVRQGGLLPRRVAEPCPPGRVQEQGRALPRHPRGRPARRGADGDLDQAGRRSCPAGSRRPGDRALSATPGAPARFWLDGPVRIPFTFAGGTGHFLPLVPVARAAERAGHAVAFAGQDGMVPTIHAAGFTALASGGASLLSTDERAPLLVVDPEREARAIRNTFAGRIARERADSILAVCAEWPPDILCATRSTSDLPLRPSVSACRTQPSLHRMRVVRPEQPCRRAAERRPSGARACRRSRPRHARPVPRPLSIPGELPRPDDPAVAEHAPLPVGLGGGFSGLARGGLASGAPRRACGVPDTRDDLQPGVR